MSSFYPRPIAEFLTWGDKFVAQTNAKTAALGISSAELTSLNNTWNAYKDAQATASARATRVVLAIAEARKRHDRALAAITLVKNAYVDPAHTLGALNDDAYIEFGLKPHATHHKRLPKPADLVDYEIAINLSERYVLCKYRIAGSKKRGKGKYHGVEVAFIVLPFDAPAPVKVTNGWVSAASTASPWKHAFDKADAGKRCYITMRWENPSVGSSTDSDRGKGAWAKIASFIVP